MARTPQTISAAAASKGRQQIDHGNKIRVYGGSEPSQRLASLFGEARYADIRHTYRGRIA